MTEGFIFEKLFGGIGLRSRLVSMRSSRVASVVVAWLLFASYWALVPLGTGAWVDLPGDVEDAVLDSSVSPPGAKFLYRERTLDDTNATATGGYACMRFGNGFYNVTLVYFNATDEVDLSRFYKVMVERDGKVLLEHFMLTSAVGDKFLVNVTSGGPNRSFSLNDLLNGSTISYHTNVTLDVQTGRNASWYRLHQGFWDTDQVYMDINATGNLNTSLPLAGEATWIELAQSIRLGWNFSTGVKVPADPAMAPAFNISVVLVMHVEKDFPGIYWVLNVTNHTSYRAPRGNNHIFELRPGFWPAYSGDTLSTTFGSKYLPLENGSWPSFVFIPLNLSGDIRTITNANASTWMLYSALSLGPDYYGVLPAGDGGIIGDAGFLSAYRIGWPSARQWTLNNGSISHWQPIVVVNMTWTAPVGIRMLNKSSTCWFNVVMVAGNNTNNPYVVLDSWNATAGENLNGTVYDLMTAFQVVTSGAANLSNYSVFVSADREEGMANVSLTIGHEAGGWPTQHNYPDPGGQPGIGGWYNLTAGQQRAAGVASVVNVINLSFPAWFHTWWNPNVNTVRNNLSAAGTWNVSVWVEKPLYNATAVVNAGLRAPDGTSRFTEWEATCLDNTGAPVQRPSSTAYPVIAFSQDPYRRLNMLSNISGLALAWMGGGNASAWNATMGDGDMPGAVIFGGSRAFETAFAANFYGDWVRWIEQYGRHFYLRSDFLTLGVAALLQSPFIDVSWTTLWPAEEKMTAIVPSYNASGANYFVNITVPVSSYYYVNYSINISDEITGGVEDEDLWLACLSTENVFNVSVSPFSWTHAGWNTSWVYDVSSNPMVSASGNFLGSGYSVFLRIPRTMLVNTTNAAAWPFVNLSLRIGSSVTQWISVAITPWCPISFLDWGEWTQPGASPNWGATARNASSRWTGRLLYTSGSFARVRYDEDVNGSWDSAANLSTRNWSYGWANVTIAPQYAGGRNVPSYSGGENVSLVFYIPLQPGCVQGHWPALVFVNDTSVTRYHSRDALDTALQGYYRDGSNRLLYIKTNTTVDESTVVSLWLGNKVPQLTVHTPTGTTASWVAVDANADRLDADLYLDYGSGWTLLWSGLNTNGQSLGDLAAGTYRVRVRIRDYSPPYYSFVASSSDWFTIAETGLGATGPSGVYPGYGLPTAVARGLCWCWIFLVFAGMFGVFAVIGGVDEGGILGGWFGNVRKVWLWVMLVAVFVVIWLVAHFVFGV